MLLSARAVRDNIRNRDGQRVYYLAKGDQLSSEARDYLASRRIDVLPAEQARPVRYRLLCGGYVEEKPEHMTHLSGDILVPKTHPRIAFRGAMDTLESVLLLGQVYAPGFSAPLQEILTFARKLLSCEVMEEAVELDKLCGLTEQELHRRSHFPQEYYGQPHFMPESTDGTAVLWLNRCRTAARSAELAGAAAFVDKDGQVQRLDLLRGLNRMSSMLYLLMIHAKGESHG